MRSHRGQPRIGSPSRNNYGATTIWFPPLGEAPSDYQAHQPYEAAVGGTVDAGPHVHRNRVTTKETIGMDPDNPTEDLTDLGN
jgi:hypothetical protein